METMSILEQLEKDTLDSITVEMLDNLEYGEELKLNKYYTLYHYCEEDVVVVNETAEWNEVFQVLWDSSTKEITFESLVCNKIVSLKQLKNIVRDITADKEWINDSHTASEYKGVVYGLEKLLEHIDIVNK